MGLISLVGLWACTSDDEAPQQAQDHELPIGLSASAPVYVEESAEARGITRSWTPPTSYYLYDALYAEGSYFNSLTNKTIDVFFARTEAISISNDPPTALPNPIHCHLAYSKTKGWQLRFPNTIDPTNSDVLAALQGDFYLYGFIPADAADKASIDPLPAPSTYADGAVLKIQGLQATGSDACVIIGAREGFGVDTSAPADGIDDEYYDGSWEDVTPGTADVYNDGTDIRTNRIQAGDFKFYLSTATDPPKNYLFLLFDHLGSALTMRMRVNGKYNELRTIKLKKIRVRATDNENHVINKMDVTITLKKNTTGAIPYLADDGVTENIVIDNIVQASLDSQKGYGTVFQNAEGVTLTTDFQSFVGHFVTHENIKKLYITSTYDVYDKNPKKDANGDIILDEHNNPIYNLIRKDCEATNELDLKDLFFSGEQISARRGYKYIVNMTINPTYIYMLSEPDLDNPTVTVE